jgi:four helix bundle protein
MFNFEQIIAYKKAIDLTNCIYELTNNWPRQETFALTDQIHRSITSIALNIAEGSSRTHKDFCHFLDISRGSCFESVAILAIAKKQGYINDKKYNELYNTIEELVKIIQGLKKSLL